MRRDGWLRFVWRYMTSQRHKLVYEREAYKVSVAHGMYIAEAARALSRHYRFDDDGSQLTIEQATQLLEVKNV
jgi:hypothetical protein